MPAKHGDRESQVFNALRRCGAHLTLKGRRS